MTTASQLCLGPAWIALFPSWFDEAQTQQITDSDETENPSRSRTAWKAWATGLTWKPVRYGMPMVLSLLMLAFIMYEMFVYAPNYDTYGASIAKNTQEHAAHMQWMKEFG